MAREYLKKETAEAPNILTFLAALLIVTVIVSSSASEILANDSIARIGAGGITFMKTEDIRMLEEVLVISLDRIWVRYRFLNESSQDIHTTVAFPLPPRKGTFDEEFQPSQERFVSTFAVLVNGRPVPTAPHGTDAVYWDQSFPAGQEVAVEHTYTPMSGARYESFGSGAGFVFRTLNRLLINLLEMIPTPPGRDSECLDLGTKRAIKNRAITHLDGGRSVTVFARDIEYILGTGRNWKGPIGKFILRIETKPPDQFMSVCFPGEPKQVSPSVYEVIQTDFVPSDILVVYFYTVESR